MANNNNPQKIGNDISTEIFSASNENGKINVQVTVLVGEFLFILFFVCLLFCMCFFLKAFKLIEVMIAIATPQKKKLLDAKSFIHRQRSHLFVHLLCVHNYN